ncbi:pfdn5 [Symbiodinium sp. CCMP2592]|nr:pfdn5 [Symbiodinium sp. CCMP2592]
MAEEEAAEQEEGGIPLSQASLQQLNVVKQQLEQEVRSLLNNQQALREAEARFQASMETLKSLCPENHGKPMLIPLTSSLYIDGHMTETKKVTVDVGTGYYIEMSVEKAQKFCNRRCKLLADNAARVEGVLKDKRKNLETLQMTMQQKMYLLQQQQEAAKEKDA